MRPLGRLRQAVPISWCRFIWLLKLQVHLGDLTLGQWTVVLHLAWKKQVKPHEQKQFFAKHALLLDFYGICLARLSSVILYCCHWTNKHIFTWSIEWKNPVSSSQGGSWIVELCNQLSTSIAEAMLLACKHFTILSIHGFCSLTFASCRGLSCNLVPVTTRLSGWT